MKYAITGSTGAFGLLAIKNLLALGISSKDIVAIARSEPKAGDLKPLGLEVRLADYNDKASYEKALVGVDRLLLVSSSEIGARDKQHGTVIEAAKKSGVKYLVYTSLHKADTSANPLASDHKSTEAMIKASGLSHTILRNNWYTENYAGDLQYAKDSGVIAAAVGKGKVASASRPDLAEAAAKVLSGTGHEGKTYEFTGSKAWDYVELAEAVGEVLGRKVEFKNLTDDERLKGLLGAGLPKGIAHFVLSLDKGIAAGTLETATTDLEKILGRKPLSLKEGLKALV